MKAQLLVLGLISLSGYLLWQQESREDLFEAFLLEHGKSYNLVEKKMRYGIFLSNLRFIEEENRNPQHTYKLGVTVFSDLTAEEFKATALMNNLFGVSHDDSVVENFSQVKATPIDWSTKGAVSPIKNQGQCGSCWSFSTTGAIQSAYFLKKGTMMSFSEQQLVDCCGSKGFGCQGCSGAWPEQAMNYISKNGAMTESQYPYTARDGSCKATAAGQMILDATKPWTMTAKGNVAQLQAALQKQPVSICVDASRWSQYRSGIFNNCAVEPLDHAVLLVGEDANGIWKVKNSWGTGWGEGGFIRLAAGNTCGVAEHALLVNIA